MGGDIKGGGMTIYESIPEQNPSLIYGEGLRVPKTTFAGELDNLQSTATFGKKKGFDRGIIIHQRSNATQYLAFHALYGGFRKSILERYIWRYWIRTWGLRTLPLYSLIWIIQVIGHRDYDNNAYAYFYFTD